MNPRSSILFALVILLSSTLAGCVFEDLRQPGLFVPSDGGAADGGDAEVVDMAADVGEPGDMDMGQPEDAEVANDMGEEDMSDAEVVDASDMSGDVGVDMGCSDTIPPVPLTSGMVCTTPSETTPGICDPVAQTGCGSGEQCDLQLNFSPEGVPTGFSSNCAPYLCERAMKAEGEACVEGECLPGFKCNVGVCRRFCQLVDGLGCAPDQACGPRGLARSYGFCQMSCS